MTPALAFIMASTALDLIKERPELWAEFQTHCGLLLTVEECKIDAATIDTANKWLWNGFDKLEELANQILRIPDSAMIPKQMAAKA